MTAEIRQFSLHPDIIFSIIHAQAGRFSKAIAEGVMNAIDAGATRLTIELNEKTYVLDDDGGGFKSREEIEQFFEKFGTPHKEGDAKMGRYRMGRGQLFSFSSTVWRSGEFLMDVDVKARGIDYHLTTLAERHAGCRIEGTLYEPLLPSEVESVGRELADMVRYVPIPITLNGQLISRDPEQEKWDIETDDAYIKLRASGGLRVYNLGVLVREYSSHQFGTGGIVVSKIALAVNFARNEVLFNRCDVWKRISTKLKSDADKRTTRKTSMNAEEREYLATQLAIGAVDFHTARDARIITDVTGKHVPLATFYNDMYKLPMTVAPEKGSRIGEKAHKHTAFVLAPETLDRFGVDTIDELRALLAKVKGAEHGFGIAQARDFSRVAESFSDRFELIKPADLTAQQTALMGALSDSLYVLTYRMAEAGYVDRDRRHITLHMGESDSAEAWTDCRTYIALHIDNVEAAIRTGHAGVLNLGALLVHELLHTDADLADHGHPPEFYEAFHNIVCNKESPLSDFADAVMSRYVAGLRKINKKVPKKYLKQADAAARVQANVNELEKQIAQLREAA